jgi:phosphatidate cytidylyltransferase
MVAIGDTAHPLAHDNPVGGGGGRGPGTLRLRIASALVLGPLVLLAAWLGPPLLSILVVAAAIGMGWEWGRLCRRRDSGISAAVIIAAIGLSVALAALHHPLAGLLLALLGGLAVALRARRGGIPGLAGAGVPWIAIPCVALLWLAQDATSGRATVFWVLAIVWATDIGAYAVGRSFGGPRLAPRFSPNKTWSGLCGGVVCAALAGGATAAGFGAADWLRLVPLGGVLAIVAQLGDLAESLAKRHFGVKDASDLIPGHGGLLDRLDGMLAVIPAVALFSLITGSSVLTWR